MPVEVHRETGDGWWYTERSGLGGESSSEEGESLVSEALETLLNPNFIAAVIGVLVAQFAVGYYYYRKEKHD